MIPRGGTELLYNNLIKHVGQAWQQHVNLIVSFCDPGQIQAGKTNVVWQHLMHDQAATQGMNSAEFVQSVDQFVYVSDWQLQQFRQKFNIESAHNVVIKNAIDALVHQEKPSGKIKLIYTSMPNRGLDILLDAFDLMNRSDVELTVFSSNIIYGLNYSKSVGPQHEKLFHRCRNTTGVTYRGYAMNKAVRQALQQSHILAYPSTYEETSCLAAIEAGAAGCKIVTTALGALPETCAHWADYVEYTTDRQELITRYAHALNNAVNEYQHHDSKLKQQSDWFNEYYSWQSRKHTWHDFLNHTK